MKIKKSKDQAIVLPEKYENPFERPPKDKDKTVPPQEKHPQPQRPAKTRGDVI